MDGRDGRPATAPDHRQQAADRAARRGRWLRRMVMLAAAAEAVFYAALLGVYGGAFVSTGDGLGRNIALPMMLLAAIPLLLCAVPAFLLGLLNRCLPCALVLCAIPPLATAFVFPRL